MTHKFKGLENFVEEYATLKQAYALLEEFYIFGVAGNPTARPLEYRIQDFFGYDDSE